MKTLLQAVIWAAFGALATLLAAIAYDLLFAWRDDGGDDGGEPESPTPWLPPDFGLGTTVSIDDAMIDSARIDAQSITSMRVGAPA